MTTTEAALKHPTPRRRSNRAHQAILAATLDLLRTTRYAGLTIEAIAARAGVGKATVYRWWPSKGALVAEAISSALTVDDPTATGDLRQDLIAAVEVSIGNYAHSSSGALIAALAADLTDDPEFAQSLVDSFVLTRRGVVAELIDTGIAVGALPTDTDADVIMDMWAGAIFYRAVLRHSPISDDLAEMLVDTVMSPARCPDGDDPPTPARMPRRAPDPGPRARS